MKTFSLLKFYFRNRKPKKAQAQHGAKFSKKFILLRRAIQYGLLLLFYLSFVTFSDQSLFHTSNNFCTAFAIILHFLLLITFSGYLYWGFLSYRTLVLLFRMQQDWISRIGKYLHWIFVGKKFFFNRLAGISK